MAAHKPTWPTGAGACWVLSSARYCAGARGAHAANGCHPRPCTLYKPSPMPAPTFHRSPSPSAPTRPSRRWSPRPARACRFASQSPTAWATPRSSSRASRTGPWPMTLSRWAGRLSWGKGLGTASRLPDGPGLAGRRGWQVGRGAGRSARAELHMQLHLRHRGRRSCCRPSVPSTPPPPGVLPLDASACPPPLPPRSWPAPAAASGAAASPAAPTRASLRSARPQCTTSTSAPPYGAAMRTP